MKEIDFSSCYRNFKYNIDAIDSISQDYLSLSKKHQESNRKFSCPLHEEIFSTIQKYFPRYRISEVLISYSDNLIELITKIGLYDKYKDTVQFINYGDENDEKIHSDNTCCAVILIGESLGFDNRKTEDHISLIMNYVYLHTIFDEYILGVTSCCYIARDMLLQYEKSKRSSDFIKQLEKNNYFKPFKLKLEKRQANFSKGAYSYKIEYITKGKFNINATKDLWFDDMILFGEIRNSLIHNRGFVNDKIIEKLQVTKYAKSYVDGEKFNLSIDDFNNWVKKIKDVSEAIYDAILVEYQKVVY